jgi:SHS2 domain-containing protein
MGYRFLEHTADVMVEAYGASIGEAFSFGAKAMFEVMFDTKRVAPKSRATVVVSASDLEGLLYSWLEELLFRFDADKIAFSWFKFDIFGNRGNLRGKGEARGEPYDRAKHGARTEVKAVTYSEMKIVSSRKRSEIRFVLDI